MQRNELTGQVFNRLTVVRFSRVGPGQNVLWLCRCICGVKKEVYAYDLRNGRVRSCGCFSRDNHYKTHGLSRTPTYSVWATMMQRCANEKDRNYPHYGGRGITVCKRWHKFENFFADMGRKPDGLTIERRDNNKGYRPSNCYWATYTEQARNKRSTVRVRVADRDMAVIDALACVKRTRSALHYQMRTYALTHQGVLDKWQQKNTR